MLKKIKNKMNKICKKYLFKRQNGARLFDLFVIANLAIIIGIPLYIVYDFIKPIFK